MSTPVLSVKNLRKSFKRGIGGKTVHALKGVSFDIKPATITGFLGANGAGKTTSIKCLLDLAFADSGEIRYFGGHELNSEVKARIGFLPERPYFYEYLTGFEFLRFYGQLSGKFKSADLNTRIDRLLKRVGLLHAKDRQLRSYSKGMLQRVGIAQTLIHEPEFIILDEPMTGLDPDGRLEVAQIIQETAKAGTAVFFSSHHLADSERLCDQLVILKLGDLIYDGSTEEFLRGTETGYSVSYRNSNHGDNTVTVATLGEAQSLMERLLKEKAEIFEVKPHRLSLEEAFVKVAFDKKEDKP